MTPHRHRVSVDDMEATIGRAIAARRRELGLSQREAASEAGVSLVTWSRWETGAMAPQLERLRRVAEVLRMNLADLI